MTYAPPSSAGIPPPVLPLSKMLPMGETCEAFAVDGGNTTPPPTTPGQPHVLEELGCPRNAAHKKALSQYGVELVDTWPQSSSRVVMVHPFPSSPVLPSPLASEQSSRHSANALSWVLGFRMTEDSGFAGTRTIVR